MGGIALNFIPPLYGSSMSSRLKNALPPSLGVKTNPKTIYRSVNTCNSKNKSIICAKKVLTDASNFWSNLDKLFLGLHQLPGKPPGNEQYEAL
jgi:hypothetical protein